MPVVVVCNLYKTTGPLWWFRQAQKSVNNNTSILYTHTFSVHAFLYICVCMIQRDREGEDDKSTVHAANENVWHVCMFVRVV